MSTRLSPDCTYKPGDETCFRPDCDISCMRNYQDKADCDVPLTSQAKPPEPKPVSWWRALFSRRHTRGSR